jgi:hypothetical protein
MPKLGVVPQGPDPVDPFKNQAPPGVGVVPTTEVSVSVPAPKSVKLGAVVQRPSQVISVDPKVETGPPVGVVPPVVSPSAPAAAAAPKPVGTVTDQTPIYPPPPEPEKPNLGTVKDLSITPLPPPSDEEVPPLINVPNVVDPFAPKE